MKNIVSIVDCNMDQDYANYLFNESIFYQNEEDQLKPIPGMFMQLTRDKNERFVPSWRKELEQLCTVPMDLNQVKPFEKDKIRLNFLIDSKGFDAGMIFSYYKILIDHVRSNGGKVNAYVSNKAYSAAELLSREADHLNYLENSKFMWHLPGILGKSENSEEILLFRTLNVNKKNYWKNELLKDGLDNYRKKLRSYFKNKKRTPNIEELLEHVEDGDLILNGRQIDNLLNLGNLSSNLNEMRNKFCYETGLSLEKEHPVSAFFDSNESNNHKFELKVV